MEKAKEDKDLIENDVAVMWKRVISQVGQEVSNHHIIQSLSACRSFGNSMEYNTVPWVSHVLFHHLSGTFWYSIFGNAHVEIPLIQFDCRNKSGHSSSILQRKMPIWACRSKSRLGSSGLRTTVRTMRLMDCYHYGIFFGIDIHFSKVWNNWIKEFLNNHLFICHCDSFIQ